MEKSSISYKIEHNDEDFFFPITVSALYDNRVISTDFASTMEEAFQIISDKEKEFESNILEENDKEL